MKINKLTNEDAVRCTIWIAKPHKTYIEDAAYTSDLTQRDILYQIIQDYMTKNPIEPIKE